MNAAVIDRYRGAMLGLAAGDALGTTLEFKSPGSFTPITDIVGGGPFRLAAGAWTDDTSMALCLAESLLECGDFDAVDQMRRYVRWWKKGHWSSVGFCFDIGTTTSSALSAFESSGNGFSGSTHDNAAGNGSLMRLAPVPLRYARDPDLAIRMAGDSSRTTHGAATAIDACRYFAGLIVGALHGARKEELLGERYAPVPGLWDEGTLHAEVDEVAAGSFKRRSPPEIRGAGYVVHSLEAALWALHATDDFTSGALAAVNLGDDADTTGAVYGQLAGAYYGAGGERGVPERWTSKLVHREAIADFGERLHLAAGW